jgi:hypothetical protein
MKRTTSYERINRSRREVEDMKKYILLILHGNTTNVFTERARQFFTWGANKFKTIASTDGCYGISFVVSGLKFQGEVRIYYNIGSDYFDVELWKDGHCENEITDLDFEQLHNVIHRNVECDTDPWV